MFFGYFTSALVFVTTDQTMYPLRNDLTSKFHNLKGEKHTNIYLKRVIQDP